MRVKAKGLIDLFSGGGGLSLGAHLAGFETICALELDRDVSARFEDNFPRATVLREDIRSVNPLRWLEKEGIDRSRIIGIIGGPPCQGFSVMGHREVTDPRNDLLAEFFRFVRLVQPAFFLFENVPNLLAEDFRHLLFRELDRLSTSYHLEPPALLQAANFGVPTDRSRLLVMGYRTSEINPVTMDDIMSQVPVHYNVRDALSDLPQPMDAQSDDDGEYWALQSDPHGALSPYAAACRLPPPPGLSSRKYRLLFKTRMVSGFHPTIHSPEVRARFQATLPGKRERLSRYHRLSWEERCPTLRAGTASDRGRFQAARPIHPEGDRVITVREAARLQGFPDWFLFHPTRWHSFRIIGNSVPPPLAASVLRLIYNAL